MDVSSQHSDGELAESFTGADAGSRDAQFYFKEIKPCGILCTENHPYSTVERFGHWYYSRGQDKNAGIHASEMKWRLFTKDKDMAIHKAKAHIE